MSFQSPPPPPESRKLADYKDRLLVIRPQKWDGRISSRPKEGQDPHYTVIMSTVLVLDDESGNGQVTKAVRRRCLNVEAQGPARRPGGTGDWSGGRLRRESEGQFRAYYLEQKLTEDDSVRVNAALSSFKERPVVDTRSSPRKSTQPSIHLTSERTPSNDSLLRGRRP
jgi:hypothetical protein